jgi:predicted porin
MGNISTKIFGHARAGAAARDVSTPTEDGWEEAFALDGYLGGEVSAITQTGIEYGVSVGLRGAYTDDGTLFGGAVGDCALGTAGCAGQVVIAGTPLALRGHSSQLFTGAFGENDEARVALEAAHIFVRTGYGDLTLGRDTGAAELFSLGAPQLDGTIGLSRGRADFTGLSIAKSVNDPTGFSEKITYTSPRLGGDMIGFGAQIGASFTPDLDACGTYTCYRRNGSTKAGGSVGAVLEDAWEVGLSVERTVGDVKAELTGTYASAGLKESLSAFDDLQSWGIGAELSWRDFKLGGGYLQSNNALADGDWSSWDAGLAWSRGPWGARLGYAYSEDENVNVEADEYTLGMTRALSLAGNEIIVGAGVQRVNRTAPYAIGGVVSEQDEDATAIYIETGWTF